MESDEAGYTLGHDDSVLASHGVRTAATSAAYLLPHLAPGVDVLDVGCGPGSITLDLAAVVAPGRVTGLENVEAPLSVARAAAAERGDTRTRFQRGDALALPFPDDAFDVVHAHQVLQHVADPVAVLREMARVCRPGGIVAARDGDYAGMHWHPEVAGLESWRDAYRAMARAQGGEPDAGRRLRAWARAAGLVGLRFSGSTWTYATPEACTWWGESQALRVLDDTFGRRAGGLGLTTAEVEAMAEAWRSWGRHPDAWFVIPHGELISVQPAD